jgi:hypothetical protein
MPPHLAGREREFEEFSRLLNQQIILENMVLTGLRGVGKTVLLDKFKPLAMERGWVWVGTDLSESASVREETLALRLLTDLAVATSSLTIDATGTAQMGFHVPASTRTVPVSYELLTQVYSGTPGLASDKIKAVLEFAAKSLAAVGRERVIFAYDEAQNLSDNADKEEYPLSVLLDVFQSIQKKGIPFMLVLTGLPTLLPKLVAARTFAERMFRVVTLGRLSNTESAEAITKPVQVAECPVHFDAPSVALIANESAGYPYFIQFYCREIFDVFIQQLATSRVGPVNIDAIRRKLDSDFFTGRWAKATDRQRQLLWIIASLFRPDEEFTVQEIVATGKRLLPKAFSSSHANQMLAALCEQGLVYKNRFGKYSFAVPLFGSFILRTYDPPIVPAQPSEQSLGVPQD